MYANLGTEYQNIIYTIACIKNVQPLDSAVICKCRWIRVSRSRKRRDAGHAPTAVNWLVTVNMQFYFHRQKGNCSALCRPEDHFLLFYPLLAVSRNNFLTRLFILSLLTLRAGFGSYWQNNHVLYSDAAPTDAPQPKQSCQ